MGKIIDGEDFIILIDDKTTFHAESHKIALSRDKKERRTKDTNGKVFVAGDLNWSATGSGLMCIKDTSDTEVMDTPDMLAAMVLGKEVTIITKCKLPDTGFGMYTGKGLIVSFDIDAGVGADSKYNYTVEGGALEPVDSK